MQIKNLLKANLIILTIVLFRNCSSQKSNHKDNTSFSDPFIVTGEHGHTNPRATMPFQMVQLSPDTRHPSWVGSSDYHIQINQSWVLATRI